MATNQNIRIRLKAFDHRVLDPVHAVRTRFLESFLILPVIVLDPVASDHGAGSIGAAFTMHED